jgi:hypothetical protein
MRAILTTGISPANLISNLLVGALLAVIYLLITSRFFVLIYRKNLVSGNIARFNAEAL